MWSASAATTAMRSARSGARAAIVRGSSAASTGSISTPTTWPAPASSRASVSEPRPGPTSSTTSCGSSAASAAIRRTVPGSTTKFWPSRLDGRTSSRPASSLISPGVSSRTTVPSATTALPHRRDSGGSSVTAGSGTVGIGDMGGTRCGSGRGRAGAGAGGRGPGRAGGPVRGARCYQGPKVRWAVAVTVSHRSARSMSLTSARQRRVSAVSAGSLGLPRLGTGVRNGASVSARMQLRRGGRGGVAERLRVGERDVAGERHHVTGLGALLDHGHVAGEAVEHHPVRRALLLQDAQHVGVRLPVVDHQRLAGPLRDLDVLAEPPALDVGLGVVAVVVEPGLADRDDARPGG